MPNYIFSNGEGKILTPFVKSFSDIEIETKESYGVITNKSKYPNGFVLEMEQRSGFIIIKTNKPLIDNGDGTFTVPE